MSFAGPTAQFVAVMFPSKHDNHVIAWRWSLQLADSKLRVEAVKAHTAQMIAEMRKGR